MQDGWNPRAHTRDSAFPAAPTLPSLRSVSPAPSAAAMTSSTTGLASSAAYQPHYEASAAFPQHQARPRSPYEDELQQYRHQQRVEHLQHSPTYSWYPVYRDQMAHPAASGAYDMVYVKQEVVQEPPRDAYSASHHAFAQSLPLPSTRALPKLSHMLRASSLNDVLNTQSRTHEPEAEPEYVRRSADLRAPAVTEDLHEAKSSLGFILGGQDCATYTSTAASTMPPARATDAISHRDAGYYNEYPPHQPAPRSAHSSPPTYWGHDPNETLTTPHHAPPQSLLAGGRAASAPVLSAVSLQRKIENARPASRTCKYEGCEQYVVDHGLCVRHGGGKRCLTEGCTSRAKHFGRCWRHGGSIECKVDGCINRAKSRGYCWSHGGGTKCKAHPCEKIAISNGLCWAHGGGKRCVVSGCRKQAYERTRNFCNSHFQLFKKGLLPPSAVAAATFEFLEQDAHAAAATSPGL